MQNSFELITSLTKKAQENENDSLTVGIDIGGTNIDGVLLKQREILAVSKVTTTSPIHDGIKTVISQLLEKSGCKSELVKYVMIGTTSFINAVLQAKELNKVLTIRLGKPATTAVDPFFDWPDNLNKIVNVRNEIINGGHEFDGREISPLDKQKLSELAFYTKSENIKYVAITGVFANANPQHEKEAAKILKAINPELQITLSHEIGGMNLLLRENATILNASLSEYFNRFSEDIKQSLLQTNLTNGVLYFSLNDGSLNNPENIFPITTYCSGQSNSIRGASLLTKYRNAFVVDVGGTSADVGVLINGFALESGYEIKIGNNVEGISCSFVAPLTRSYGLGGGSIVRINKNGDISIGPDSVGSQLNPRAKIFGGDTLTLTDIAVAKGRLNVGDASKVKLVSLDIINQVDDLMHQKIADVVNKVLHLTKENKVNTLILVGGGASLISKEKLSQYLDNSIIEIEIPEYAGFANALGAACAKISGVYSGIFQYTDIDNDSVNHREKAIKFAKQKAIENALEKGADIETLTIQEIEETPINYVPGNCTLLRIKLVGELNNSYVNSHMQKSEPVAKTLPKIEQTLNLSAPDASSEEPNYKIQPHNSNASQSSSHSSESINVIENNDAMNKQVVCFTEQDIVDIALGTGFLGSGGGGNTKVCEVITKEFIRHGKKIKMLPFEAVPDESLCVAVGVMGAPTVLAEKLPSKEESLVAITELEKILNKKIDYLIAMEVGGMNGLYAIYISAQSNKLIINGDCMGRALPEIQMVTPGIYHNELQYVAVLSNGQTSIVLKAANLRELELIARKKTTEMGGIVTLAYLPMSGKLLKKCCVPNSLSVAKNIGVEFRKEQNDNYTLSINKALSDSGYGPACEIISGKIVDLQRNFTEGFNKGYIIIADSLNTKKIKIEFQNENLMLIDFVEYRILAQVPTIITLIDNERNPISCELLRIGLDVTVYTLMVPKILLTEKALSVIGCLSENQKEYILEELAVLEGCLAQGLGFLQPGAINQSYAKEPLFIAYPAAEESAFIEGKKQLKIYDTKEHPFIYDVQWLEFAMQTDGNTNDSCAIHFKSNNLIQKLLQAKTKTILFLISIDKFYHEGAYLDATINLFRNTIRNCVALVQENLMQKDISSTKPDGTNNLFVSAMGDWKIVVLAADSLQAYNKSITNEQKAQQKLQYNEKGKQWIAMAQSKFKLLKEAGSDVIKITIDFFNWDDFLSLAKEHYNYQEKYHHLSVAYGNTERTEHFAAFRGAVILKGTNYPIRAQKRQASKMQFEHHRMPLNAPDFQDSVHTSDRLVSLDLFGYSDVLKNDNMIFQEKQRAIIKKLILGLPKDHIFKKKLLNNERYNFPRLNEEFIMVRLDLLNNLESYFNKVSVREKSIVVCCHGIGGVGKTHLAAYYAEKNQHLYRLLIKLDGSDEKKLKLSLCEFANELNICNKDTKQHEALNILASWFQIPENFGSFILVEDVEDYELIKKYLPKVGAHIIITSRIEQVHTQELNTIAIDIMNEEEAINLLYCYSKRNKEINEDQVTLVNKLGYLPLALEMAGSYLRRYPEITLATYIELFRENFIDLMSDKSLVGNSISHETKVVATTFHISINKIKVKDKIKNRSSLAEQLLILCCYLAPENISFLIFEKWLKIHFPKELSSEENLLLRVLQQLEAHSLIKINSDERVFSIHSILQDAIRNHPSIIENALKNKELLADIIVELCKELRSDVNANLIKIKLNPHITNVMSQLIKEADILQETVHADDMWKIINKSLRLLCCSADCITPLIRDYLNLAFKLCLPDSLNNFNLYDELPDIFQFKTELEFIEQLLAFLERMHGQEHYYLVPIMEDLVRIYAEQGDIVKRKILLQRILAIKLKNIEENSCTVAKTILMLSATHGAENDQASQRELLWKAERIMSSYRNNGDLDTANVLAALACEFEKNDILNKQNEYVMRAITCYQQLEGNHFQTIVDLLLRTARFCHRRECWDKEIASWESLIRMIGKENPKQKVRGYFLLNLGVAHGLNGDLNNKIKLLEEALEIFETNYDSRMEVTIRKQVRDAQNDKQQIDTTLICNLQQFNASDLSIVEGSEACFNPKDIIKTLIELLEAYTLLGMVDQQIKVLNRLFYLYDIYEGPASKKMQNILIILGKLNFKASATPICLELYKQALGISENIYGNNYITEALMSTLGMIYIDLGDYVNCYKIMSKLLSIISESSGKNSDKYLAYEKIVNLASFQMAINQEPNDKIRLTSTPLVGLVKQSSDIKSSAQLTNLLSKYKLADASQANLARGMLAAAENGNNDDLKIFITYVLEISENLYGNDETITACLMCLQASIYVNNFGGLHAYFSNFKELLNMFGQLHGQNTAKYLMFENVVNIASILMKKHQESNDRKSISAALSVGLFKQPSDTNSSNPLTLLLSKYKLADDSQANLEKGLRNAAVKGNHEDLKIFIAHVKNINAQDNNPESKRTALHWAKINGFEECIKLLVSAGADDKIKDAKGLSPADSLLAKQGLKI